MPACPIHNLELSFKTWLHHQNFTAIILKTIELNLWNWNNICRCLETQQSVDKTTIPPAICFKAKFENNVESVIIKLLGLLRITLGKGSLEPRYTGILFKRKTMTKCKTPPPPPLQNAFLPFFNWKKSMGTHCVGFHIYKQIMPVCESLR